jgi:hypothetical protein
VTFRPTIDLSKHHGPASFRRWGRQRAENRMHAVPLHHVLGRCRRFGNSASVSPRLVCRAVEVDPLYVDVIVCRYEIATGDAATLIETGETFEALCARRASEAAPV